MAGKQPSYHPCIFSYALSKFQRLFYCAIFFVLLQPVKAQLTVEVDEVSVDLYVSGIGDTSITALISNEKAWLSISDIFEFLKIRHNISDSGNILSGFFINVEDTYRLDASLQLLYFNNNIVKLANSAIKKQNKTLFLRADLFYELFKLNCRFDYRSLSVKLFTSLELPIIREKKQALLRSNIGKLKNELKADMTIGREFAAFRLGMLDWSFNTTNDFKGISDIRVNVAMGGVIAGGETTIALQYNKATTFSTNQQYYLWRHINNEKKILKQVSVGKINANATSSIFASVIGVQFSNSPTVFRRSFGTYTINRYTQPGWMVELYVNSTLINYTIADASGFYSFDVPVVYGNTQIQIRYYGPNGEQRIGEANITMPFTFLPVGSLEYNVTAGLVEDSSWSRFSRIQLNYGLIKRVTLGTGVEYLSSITNGKVLMPFITTSFRFSRNILFSSEYMHGVKSNITGNYRLPSNLLFEVHYTRYVKGQQAIYNTYLEERRIAISSPLRFKKISTYSRFSFYQIILPQYKYTTAELLFSGVILGISTNFTTYALFTDKNKAYLYSNLSLGIRIPGRIIFMPQAQYEYNNRRFISIKGEIEKRITTKGSINGFYERNFKSNFTSINIGFRYDLPHTQAEVSVRRSTGTPLSLSSSIRGSLVHDSRSGFTSFTKEASVGRGGLILSTFLDLNNNGRRDQGEPRLKGLKFVIAGGFREENKRDTTIIIRNLEAYNSYLLTIDKNSFDEIAWQLKTSTIKIEIDPNQFRLLEIPVIVSGEVSGTIYTQTATGKKTQERILVNIYNNLGVRVVQVLSESDGYYSFLGLVPGSYTIKTDPEQMQHLNLQFFPSAWHFEIEALRNGDIQRNIDFTLKSD